MRKLITIFLVLCVASVSAAIVGQWKLNEPTGTSGADSVKDLIGGNHGTPAKATTTVISPVGPGQSFDGSQWITETDQIIADYPLSMSIWARQASNQTATLLSMSLEGSADAAADRFVEVVLNNGFLRMVTKGGVFDDNDPTASTALSLNVWHLVTGVWIDKDDRRLYADGVLVGTASGENDLFPTTNDTWTIGARSAQSMVSQKFTGDLSDARIHDTALSATDVNNLYRAGTVGYRHRYSSKKNTGFARTRGRY
jgi:hypothetical protein